MNTSDVLNRAADLIEERGWTVGGGWPEPGGRENAPLCLEGGILAAQGVHRSVSDVVTCPAYTAVWDFLVSDDRWGVFRDRLYDWNDYTGRTATEVIEVLRATAVIEAARESERVEVSA